MLSLGDEHIPEGKVKDFITRQLKNSTAEEIIKQNIEKSICFEYGYDKNQIAIDLSVKTASGIKKASICVFNGVAETIPHKLDNVYIIVLIADPDKSSNDKDI